MDNPERHLFEWLRDHFFLSSDEADDAALQCSAFMRERGWQFEPIPVEAQK